MNIKIEYFDNKLELLDNFVNAIEIENKKYFYRFINDLYLNINSGFSDVITFFDNKNNEINMNDKIRIYTNFFDLGLDSKRYFNDIVKYVNLSISEENKRLLINEYNKIIKIYNKILYNIDIPLIINDNFNIENMSKILKISIGINNQLFDNVLLLIDIERVLKTNNILIFINLKQYLTKAELIELYKYSVYNQIKIILIDSQNYGVPLNNEKKFIIDDNLEEFML